VESFARPGGNATGINFLNQAVVSKRLRLLHDWCPTPFVLLCSPIRLMHQRPRPHYGSCRKPPPPSDCKSRFSTLRPSARLMPPLPPLSVSVQMLSSSMATHSSLVALCNLLP